jgi:hypothetical protein
MDDCTPYGGFIGSIVDWLQSLWDEGEHCNAT